MSYLNTLRHIGLALTTVALVGCASSSAQKSEQKNAPVTGPASAGSGANPNGPGRPLATSDLIFLVSAAEVAANRGDYKEAMRLYTRAAGSSDDYKVAKKAFELARFVNDPEVARVNLERWQLLQGEDFDGHFDAAVLYAELGDLEAARPHLDSLRDFLEAQDKDLWENMVPVVAATARRNRDAGTALFEALLDEWGFAKTTAGMQQQSRLAASLGQPDTAMKIATRSIKRGDDKAAAYGWRAQLHIADDDLASAEDDFRDAVKIDPENREVRVGLARLLYTTERYDEAIEQLEAIEDDAIVLFSKAYYALEAEQNDRAEDYYRELTAFESDEVDEHAFLTGQLADELDRPEEALDWYDRVAGGDRLTPARLRMAVILSDRGDLAASRALLRNLQNGNEETATQAFQVEGTLLSEAGRNDEALVVYSRAINQMPSNDDLRYARALHAERVDQVDVAEADLRDILGRNPNDPNALNALGYTLADRTERYEEARELIERAYEMSPQEAAIVDSMGWVQYRLGNYDDALKFLRRALDIQYDAEIAAHLGEVLWVMGREDEARSVWSDALDKNPESKAILAARRRLEP